MAEYFEPVEEYQHSSVWVSRAARHRNVFLITAIFGAIGVFAFASPGLAATSNLDVRNGGGDFGSQDVKGIPDASQIAKMSYPGYPECAARVQWMRDNWKSTPELEAKYASAGVDGSDESILSYLNNHGLYCPTLADATRKIIRGVSLGGWLVLEPWIKPSLFGLSFCLSFACLCPLCVCYIPLP